MCLLRIQLATTVGPHDLDSISYRSRPVEPLPEGVADEGSGRCVVPASPRVDFSQQLLPLDDMYTSLENSRGAASVQLLLFSYQHKGLRSADEASALSLP
jgi:hypothetical protein